jgi:hypothetical protein
MEAHLRRILDEIGKIKIEINSGPNSEEKAVA